MTARFTLDPQISAGAAPFGPVRCNPATTGASLRQEMRQLVTKGAIDFRCAVLAQTTIEEDTRAARFSAAGRGTEAR